MREGWRSRGETDFEISKNAAAKDAICSGPTADGLAFPTKMKPFWVIKYLNILLTNEEFKKMQIYA